MGITECLRCTKCLFEADKVLRSGGQSSAEGKEGRCVMSVCRFVTRCLPKGLPARLARFS